MVFATGGQTAFGNIARLTQAARSPRGSGPLHERGARGHPLHAVDKWRIDRSRSTLSGPRKVSSPWRHSFTCYISAVGSPGRELANNELLYLKATTACLSAIIVSQVANAFICRSSWSSMLKLPPFSNRLLFMAVVVEIGDSIMLIDYTPVGNAVFGTAPIPTSVWLLNILRGSDAISQEFRKWLVRRRII